MSAVRRQGPLPLEPGRSVLDQLRARVTAMEGGGGARLGARMSVPVLPGLAGAITLHAGGSYAVDADSLALQLVAGASQAGEWVGFVGWPDFGAEAAAQAGVDLSRTVLVPEAGGQWLEVAAALVDVLRVVVLRPTTRVDAKSAGVLDARLRKRSAVLVVSGGARLWPRCEASLSLEDVCWTGPDRGRGRLRERRAHVVVRRGAAPPVRLDLGGLSGLGGLASPTAAAPVETLEPLQASG